MTERSCPKALHRKSLFLFIAALLFVFFWLCGSDTASAAASVIFALFYIV
jgi:hypothetical protein